MNSVTVVRHPLVCHHLSRLRDERTEPCEFRRLIQRLTMLLAFDATRDLRVEPFNLRTPLAAIEGDRLTQRIGIVPILRAGLGMVEPLLELIPTAAVWHLGLYRDEATAQPVEYYRKLPSGNPVEVGLILDPMLATGGSAGLAIAALQQWGVPQIKLLSIIASRHGVAQIEALYPTCQMYVCAVDADLDSRKFIVPGLGDAGDRTFNTM